MDSDKALAENNRTIDEITSCMRLLERARSQLDPSYRGFMLYLVQLAADSKKLPLHQRKRVQRSINNVLGSVKALGSDLRMSHIDCNFQINALKYKGESLKRDASRRKRNGSASQSR